MESKVPQYQPQLLNLVHRPKPASKASFDTRALSKAPRNNSRTGIKRKFGALGGGQDGHRDLPSFEEDDPAKLVADANIKVYADGVLKDGSVYYTGKASLLDLHFSCNPERCTRAAAKHDALNTACWWMYHGRQLAEFSDPRAASNEEVVVTRQIYLIDPDL